MRPISYLIASQFVLWACSGDSSSPVVVAAIEVSPATSSLLSLGDSSQLSAVAKDAEGQPIAGKVFRWQSLAPAIATVDSTGRVAAVSNGDAGIRASVDGQAGEAVVTVRQAPAQLDFVTAPRAGAAASVLPVVEVSVRDARGHPVLTPADVTLALAADPAGPVLHGSTTAAVAAGIARFSDLWVDLPGSGYTLTAKSGSITSAPSSAFGLVANPFGGSWSVSPTLSLDCTVSYGGILWQGEVTLQRFKTSVRAPDEVLTTPYIGLALFFGFPLPTFVRAIPLPLDQTLRTFKGSAHFVTDTIATPGGPFGTVLSTAAVSIDLDAGFSGRDIFAADLVLSVDPHFRINGVWYAGRCDAINGRFTGTRTP